MTIQDQIQFWLTETKFMLIKEYDSRGHRASGNWANELEDKITTTNNGYNASILGTKYTGIMETGRKPNINQDKGSIKAWVGWAGNTFIKDWVNRKGLSINPFAIAYKIAREGIKVPNHYNPGNLISDVITNERIEKLSNSISNIIVTNLKSDVIKQFK